MFWFKLLFLYPFTAFIMYIVSGKTLASMFVSIGILALIQLSVFMLREITNQ